MGVIGGRAGVPQDDSVDVKRGLESGDDLADAASAPESVPLGSGIRSRAGAQLEPGETRPPSQWSEANTVPGRRVPDRPGTGPKDPAVAAGRKLPLPPPRARTEDEPSTPRRFAHTVKSGRQARASMSIPLGETPRDELDSSDFGSSYDESKEFEIAAMDEAAVDESAPGVETHIPIDMNEFEDDLALSEEQAAEPELESGPTARSARDVDHPLGGGGSDASPFDGVELGVTEEEADAAETMRRMDADELQAAGGAERFDTELDPETHEVDLLELEEKLGIGLGAPRAAEPVPPAPPVPAAMAARGGGSPTVAELTRGEVVEATMLVSPPTPPHRQRQKRGLALPVAAGAIVAGAAAYFLLFAGGGDSSETRQPMAEAAPTEAPAPVASAELEPPPEPADEVDAEVAVEPADPPTDRPTETAEPEPKAAAVAPEAAEPKEEPAAAAKVTEPRAPARPPAGKPEPPARDRDTAKSLYQEGIAAFARGQLEDAERSFKASLKADSSFALPLRGLGLVHERRGAKSAAARQFRAYLKAAPQARDADAIRKRLTQLGAAR